jgi:hypothetical protein
MTSATIVDLEAKVKSAEANTADVAAASEKRLKDFVDELVHDLAKLRTLYVRNTQAIGGLMLADAQGKALRCGLSLMAAYRDIQSSKYVWQR